jgi:hypothetical protein
MKTYTYGNPLSSVVFIQPVDAHDLSFMENEIAEIKKHTEKEFYLIAVGIEDWNKELSPWCAPAVFGKEDFGDGAKETLDEIKKLCADKEKTYIIGGYSSVSYDVQTQLQNTLGISAARIYGTTRYETCLSVLKYKDFAKYVSGGTVCLTTGEKFPDALAGGVLAALTSSPMLLAKSPWEKAQTSYLHNYKRPEFALPSNYLYTLGGKNSVSETARFAACSFLSPDVSVSS